MGLPGAAIPRTTPDTEDAPEWDPDETRDVSTRRRCAFSGCRAPLPVVGGPGNKARYCQDGKVWGTKNVSCKQAGHAEEILASIRPGTTAPPLPVTELGEQVDAALTPVQHLLTALQQVRAQLDADVATARQERDDALRTAAEADSRRIDAEERAHTADQHAATSDATAIAAQQARETAEAERDRAIEARQHAERAQLRAETQREGARQDQERAEARVLAAAERAEQAEHRLASTAAELASVREQLDEQRQRADTERRRAEHAIAEHADAIDTLRQDFDARIERERAQAAADAKQIREEHEQARHDAGTHHARELSELHRKLGGTENELAVATRRAEEATSVLARYRDSIRDLLRQRDDGDTTEHDMLERLTELATSAG